MLLTDGFLIRSISPNSMCRLVLSVPSKWTNSIRYKYIFKSE
ncbi:unnamed protein product [Tenebrio molitor]|nr:unnamed protein product [Tenebrio molitor]